MTFQFLAYHPLTGTQLAPPLRFQRGHSWTEVVNGNGVFRGSLSLPKNAAKRAEVVLATEPDEAALYVRDSDSNTFVWGGPIVGQEWNPATRTFDVTAVEWRSWLFTAFLAPLTNLTADVLYSWTAVEQIQIARDIVNFATAAGTVDGRPTIAIGSEPYTGKTRDLNVKGTEFKYAGELLDTISQRSGGFEWTILIDATVAGAPSLRFATYFPERGGIITDRLLKRTMQGGNFSIDGSVTKSASERRTRVWAVGSGDSVPFAQDSDPELGTGALLRERLDSFSTVVNRTTLAQHARANRQFYGVKTNILKVNVRETDPPLSSYEVGSRFRLMYMDEVYNLDLPAVRVLEREVKPSGGAGTVSLTLDLDDSEPAEVDEGGAV